MSTLQNVHVNAFSLNIAESRSVMGERAATDISRQIRRCLELQPAVRIIFAAAPSQAEMLAALRRQQGIDWTRVTAFHMDEYIGLPAEAPQRFGLWLRRHIFDHLPFASVHLIEPGSDPEYAVADYSALLNAEPIDIVCCGIGSNGHLAFNDPPAVLDDSHTVKIVELDLECRRQQVHDGCFVSLDDVPQQAITVTVPALLAAHHVFCCVPGSLKQQAVRSMMSDEVSGQCPATTLRLHPHCAVYLDKDSASLLG